MRSLRVLGFLVLAATVLLISIYYSSKRINDISGGGSPVILIDGETHSRVTPNPESTLPTATPDHPGCIEQSEYAHMRSELGSLVNNSYMREHETERYRREVDDFRRQKGLPLPLAVISDHLEKENVVYNNCRSNCKGSVHEVFAANIIDNRFAELLLKDGSLKRFPLHESGLEATLVDELDKKGVPFRSWVMPSADGPWFVRGNDLYFKLDMDKLFLRATQKGGWEVTLAPLGAAKLNSIEPEKVLGCQVGDLCFASSDKSTRHFKAPKFCAAVVGSD